MARFDVCALGCICWDYVGIVENYPALDEKALLGELVQMGGGLSATAMVAAARLGAKAAIFGRVGDDEFGAHCLAAFAAEGVDAAGVEVVRGASSQFAFCVAHAATGKRSIFWKRGSSDRLGRGETNLQAVTDCRCVLLDNHHSAAAREAAEFALAAGTPVVVDVERPDPGTRELFGLATWPIVPESFIREATGASSLDTGVAMLRTANNRAVIVTLGERGVIAYTDEGIIRRPAYHVEPVVDTTGAGDVFHGAFSYGIALGYELEENLAFASAAAGLSCRGLGGRGALASFAETSELIKNGALRE